VAGDFMPTILYRQKSHPLLATTLAKNKFAGIKPQREQNEKIT
jgi:hypothetical protein